MSSKSTLNELTFANNIKVDAFDTIILHLYTFVIYKPFAFFRQCQRMLSVQEWSNQAIGNYEIKALLAISATLT
jgi:hypothetical protein